MTILGSQISIANTGGVGSNGGSIIVPLSQTLSCTTVSGSSTLTSSALFGTVGATYAILGTNITHGTHVQQINTTSSLSMVAEDGVTPAPATGSGTQNAIFVSNVKRALNDPYPCLIINTSSSATLYLGGQAVSSSTGFPLAPNTSVGIDLLAADTLYGIASTGTITVGVLIGRQ